MPEQPGDLSTEAIKDAIDFFEIFHVVESLTRDLNEWITKAPDAPDPIMSSLQKIHGKLNEIEDLALAGWAAARGDNLAFLLAHSSSALHTVNAFLRSGRPRSDPEWAARTALAERDSLVAVHTVVNDMESGLWLRPNSVKAISQSGDPTSAERGWMPHIEDRAEIHGLGLVWDYRWALPATIYTISIRIGVLKALGTDQGSMRSEIKRYNTFIARVFQKMESGIRSLNELTPLQIERIPTHGFPIAAADIYGGYFLGGQFDPHFRPEKFAGFPFPASVVPTGGALDEGLRNAKILTEAWRDHIAITIGLPELLQYAGRLENMLVLSPPPPVHVPEPGLRMIVHGGNDTPPNSDIRRTGVMFGVSADGILHWFRFDGEGDADIPAGLGWHPNSGHQIGNGWLGVQRLLGCGNGVILAVKPEGQLLWFRYDGDGEEDVTGGLGWHPNSGNQIGNGFHNFLHLFALPQTGPEKDRLAILGVAANGNLHWFSYSGMGEHDPSGATGWHPNSGNRIGNGWARVQHLTGSGNVIFGVDENENLHWYSYEGNGEDDVSGGTGWHPNSSNVISREWGVRNLLGATSGIGLGGHVLIAVNGDGDVFWFCYTGTGEGENAAAWDSRSESRIRQGW